MKTSDIPTGPVLAFLAAHDGEWCNWYGTPGNDRSVALAMPPGTPPKLVLAKMRNLIKRGLVGGCPCGCRGDFELTDIGRAVLDEKESPA